MFVPENDFDYQALRASKQKLKLEDLKILDHEKDSLYEFDYTNWRKYAGYRKQLRAWPNDFRVEFTKLINCKIPFSHFKENYLRIRDLTVRQVTSERLLVEFLKNVKIRTLSLDYDFNLGQSFFDEIANFLTVKEFNSYESTWTSVSDASVLDRMNFRKVELQFNQLPRQIALAILKKPFCLIMTFKSYSGWRQSFVEENRKTSNGKHFHIIRKANGVFYCIHCKWSSAKDPKCLEDSFEGVIHHIEHGPVPQNTPREEIWDIFF